MKSILHSTLETKIACSVIKSKEVLEIFGTGAVATIKVKWHWKFVSSVSKPLFVVVKRNLLVPIWSLHLALIFWNYLSSVYSHIAHTLLWFSNRPNRLLDTSTHSCASFMRYFNTMQCSPSTYDFGVLIVGTSKYYHLTLFNSGPCDLIYTLNVYNEFGDAVPG